MMMMGRQILGLHFGTCVVTSLCQTSCFPKRAAVTSLAELTVSFIFTGNHESRDVLCVLSCISNSIAWLSALWGTLCWSLLAALSGSQVPSTTSRKYPAIYPLITNTHLSLSYRAHYLKLPALAHLV